MCGLAALFAYHGAAPAVEHGELYRLLEALRHRGPDGEGTWLSPHERVGLAHTRLAIIDPRGGAQPMSSADGLAVLAFNGEIYNHRALRDQLERDGERLDTDSDTEVLLRLYQRDGEAALGRLRGMFAFVVWDARRGVLVAARDPFGIKPLYYADDGWRVRFASQVRALAALPGVSREPENAARAGVLLFGHVPEPFTWYRQVRALPAGSVMHVDELGPHAPRVWLDVGDAVARAAADGDADEAALRSALVDSVRHHLVADVPVGLFLSSGIDSAAIACAARTATGAPLEALTVTFEGLDRELDEAPGARRIADALGLAATRRHVDRDALAAAWPGVLADMDQPTVDGINTWIVSRLARERGLKAVLSGVGADELFGGYPSFTDLPRWNRWLSVPAAVPGLGRLARLALMPLVRPLGLPPKLPGIVALGGRLDDAYLLRRGIFMPWELPALLGAEPARDGLRRLAARDLIARRVPADGCEYARVAALEIGLYLRNQLLRDADWAGMAHGVEIRVPYADRGLLGVAAKAVARVGVRGGKALLARASGVASAAPELATRAKTGFSVPAADLLERRPDVLGAWRSVPALARAGSPWQRRMAYALVAEWGA